MKKDKPTPFQHIIETLLDEKKPIPARYLYRLSDVEASELALLQQSWPKVSVRRRQAVAEDIQDFNQGDFLLNFYDFGLLAVVDPDPRVRLMAVLILAEYEDEELVPQMIQLSENDADMFVRAAAASALGNLVEMGELEELEQSSLNQVEECLLRIFNSQDAKTVRLRALEALGYSSRQEVIPLIRAAYQSDEDDWLASSLLAMGRSFDAIWEADLLAALRDPRTSVRAEAVRAAGELELEEARPALIDMLLDSETSVRQSAIWSLSQIGGNNVREVLEKLLDTSQGEDDEEIIESALENLEFTEGFANFNLMDFDEELEDGELADDSLFEDEDLDTDDDGKN